MEGVQDVAAETRAVLDTLSASRNGRNAEAEERLAALARERPQEVLEALMWQQRIASGRGKVCWPYLRLLKTSAPSLDLRCVWTALLASRATFWPKELCVLVEMLGEVQVPRSVAAESVSVGRGCVAWLLLLLSDAEHARLGLERVLFDESARIGVQVAVVSWMQVAVRRHSVDVVALFRECLARKRGARPAARLLSPAQVRLLEQSLSEEEWGALCEDEHLVSDLAPRFVSRPDRVVRKCLERARALPSSAAAYLSPIVRFLTAGEMAALWTEAEAAAAPRDVLQWLGWMVTLPQVATEARLAALRRWLPQGISWQILEHRSGDWSAFSDEQLTELVVLDKNMLSGEAFAKELVRRNLFPPVVRKRMDMVVKERFGEQNNKHAQVRIGVGFFQYALRDHSLFASLSSSRLSPQRNVRGVRELIFSLVGRWSPCHHLLLPLEVQQVALVTLWALTPRVRTRHVVYLILQEALVCKEPLERASILMEQWQALLLLLRGESNGSDERLSTF